MITIAPRLAPICCALVLALGLHGCTSGSMNSSLNSVHQPVVERTTYMLDLASAAGNLAPGEQQRLDQWFGSLALGYGDRLEISGAAGDAQIRAAIAAAAARHGTPLASEAFTTGPGPAPGMVRVALTRSSASVPGCPGWAARSDAKFDNATSSSFGCAVNGNFAAMVADPEHLLKGARGSGGTVVMSATKAIAAYRAQPPMGAQDAEAVLRLTKIVKTASQEPHQ